MFQELIDQIFCCSRVINNRPKVVSLAARELTLNEKKKKLTRGCETYGGKGISLAFEKGMLFLLSSEPWVSEETDGRTAVYPKNTGIYDQVRQPTITP